MQPADEQQGGLPGEWGSKDATLSDATARKAYSLTQLEIHEAIRQGQLHFREGSAHGNPFLRLLLREVEALVEAKFGAAGLKALQTQAEVQKIDKELRTLRTRIAALEALKAKLLGP